jgi:hypothetical protein
MAFISITDTQTPTERNAKRQFIHEIPMSIATYRGIKYDTEEHQAAFKVWWNKIHCDATRWFTYRGKKYRAYGECKQ